MDATGLGGEHMALNSGSEVLARGPGAAITKDIFVGVHKTLGDSQFHGTDENIFLPSSTQIVNWEPEGSKERKMQWGWRATLRAEQRKQTDPRSFQIIPYSLQFISISIFLKT